MGLGGHKAVLVRAIAGPAEIPASSWLTKSWMDETAGIH